MHNGSYATIMVIQNTFDSRALGFAFLGFHVVVARAFFLVADGAGWNTQALLAAVVAEEEARLLV